MSQVFDESVLEKPKIKSILAMLAEGRTQDEITTHFGYADWKSVYIYFNRNGFRWDKQQHTFVPYVKEPEQTNSSLDDVHLIQTKAAKIVRQLSKKIRTFVKLHNSIDLKM